MFNNWLRPSQVKVAANSYNWAGSINVYKGEEEAFIPPNQCVLIGVDEQAADAVRRELYAMSWAFGEHLFTDLGNLRKTSDDFMIPLLREVLDSGLFPILIGSTPNVVYAQFQSFLNLKELVSLVVIDEQVPISLDLRKSIDHYLNYLLKHRRESLFHLGLIGAQAHFTNPAVFDWLESEYFEYQRLGQAREDLSEMEPLIRDADMVALHLDALKQAEAPGQLNPSPSGFFLEEACQLSRYAGMSDKLRSFSIHGIDTSSKKKLRPTAQAVAQMVWYFTEGFYQRMGDYPVSNKGLVEYIVDTKGINEKLTFWKSRSSGRWWLQVPVDTAYKYQRHRLIPCSYNDYKRAIEHELPDRLWNAFRRF